MDSEDSDRPATLWQLVYLEKTQNIISSGERCLDSETMDQPVAAQNVCGSWCIFRNFQKKKKQNIVSGARCMDSETTDQPVAGQNVCGS